MVLGRRGVTVMLLRFIVQETEVEHDASSALCVSDDDKKARRPTIHFPP